MNVKAYIIPPEKLSLFDRSISSGQPHIRLGPVLIYTGPYAGNYAVNDAIFDSCPEWESAEGRKRARFEQYEILSVEDLNPEDLRDPEAQLP